MTDEKIIGVLDNYKKYCSPVRDTRTERWPPELDAPLKNSQFLSHLLWMCDEATQFVKDGRRDKAFRWLGFIQGVLWARGLFTVQDLANHSRPDGDTQ